MCDMYYCEEHNYRTDDPNAEEYHKLKHEVKFVENEQVKLMNDDDYLKEETLKKLEDLQKRFIKEMK